MELFFFTTGIPLDPSSHKDEPGFCKTLLYVTQGCEILKKADIHTFISVGGFQHESVYIKCPIKEMNHLGVAGLYSFIPVNDTVYDSKLCSH